MNLQPIDTATGPVSLYRIWWSPVGAPNGSDTISASSKQEASRIAFERMRQVAGCGAYGAERQEVTS